MSIWYDDRAAKIFQLVLSPFYKLFYFIFKKDIITIACPNIDRKSKNLFHYRNTYDYVRVRTLGLVANTIYENNIYGDVAEVGVFRGSFAERINREFPDRALLLYDTFEGFDRKQLNNDIHNKLVDTNNQYFSTFNDTNINYVINRMQFKDNILIRKGIFPETAIHDFDRQFAFVSIDVDLETPTFDALEFFYPRVSGGG